jgi:hypothetical protein
VYNIWSPKPKKWKNIFKDCNINLTTLHDGFQKYLSNTNTLETARDNVRLLLHREDSVRFPAGHHGASVAELAIRMLYPVYHIPELHLCCSHCDQTILINSNCINRVIFVPENTTGSTAQVVDRHFHHETGQRCSSCTAPLQTTIHFSDTPKILAINVVDRDITLSQTIKVMGATCSTILHLRGLVYHGGFHFTCRIIDPLGKIWFNDGISTGRTSTEDGWFGKVSQPNLHTCRNKQLCLAIYAQK